MKAIIILFNGEFNTPSNETQAMRAIFDIMHTTASMEGNLTVTTMSDADVFNALLCKSPAAIAAIKPLTFDEKLERYCIGVRKVIELNPKDPNFKRVFFAEIVNGSPVLKDEEIIKIMLDGKKMLRTTSEILIKYDLVDIPKYLREINSIINII